MSDSLAPNSFHLRLFTAESLLGKAGKVQVWYLVTTRQFSPYRCGDYINVFSMKDVKASATKKIDCKNRAIQTHLRINKKHSVSVGRSLWNLWEPCTSVRHLLLLMSWEALLKKKKKRHTGFKHAGFPFKTTSKNLFGTWKGLELKKKTCYSP